jgi:hypothetical protein
VRRVDVKFVRRRWLGKKESVTRERKAWDWSWLPRLV